MRAPAPVAAAKRPRAAGKFLFADGRKYWIKGVTYGTFRPAADGAQFPPRPIAERDLAQIAENGFNTVRTYTVPPVWLLDEAARHGLRVMVGLPWEQHVAFLDDRAITARIERSVREAVRGCAGHAAVLCYAIGNEIPPSIVRWHGPRRIERFLKRLYQIAKREDPGALVTYVNFPTTEYLRLPFLDLVCFNVYLETREQLAAYLARLQNLAGDKPLLMAEIGLDSRRNGEDAQAESLAWQIETVFAAGCAGAFAFAWTDEWYRGGHEIEDWDFGLTTRDRTPKPALAAARRAFRAVPFAHDGAWPKVSVVVCSYNGAATIRDTMDGLAALEYPDYEVIVVDDGSTDATADIVSEYDCKLIRTENRGLSSARNTGWQAAAGEIVAYIDDDAYPDPHWLHYLAHTFRTTEYVGVGGPNIAPPGDGSIADCVANAPGGPVHVLLSDTEAEHIPGCNMAFRCDALEAIGGFDTRYRAAGDDVDVCWRLQQRGRKIGFHAGAMDWHHRRNGLRLYWKQQQGYGKAEALLEQKWPEKYNAFGHFSWLGRLYGKGLTLALPMGRRRIYHGPRGSAPFQSLYEPGPRLLTALPLMPEWYLLVAALAGLSLLGLSWPPLRWAFVPLVAAVAAPIAQAVISAARAEFSGRPAALSERLKLRAITAFLHLLQPLARLKGRLDHGLTLWRAGADLRPAPGGDRAGTLWSERWRSADDWIEDIAARATARGAILREGGAFDAWDLEALGGPLGRARAQLAIEEHGAGKQLLRFKVRSRAPAAVLVSVALLALLSGGAASQGAWLASAVLAAAAGLGAYACVRQARAARAVLGRAFAALAEAPDAPILSPDSPARP